MVSSLPLGHTSLEAGAGDALSRWAYEAPRAFLTYRSSTKESTSMSPVSLAAFSTDTSCFSAETSCGLTAGSKVAMPWAPL